MFLKSSLLKKFPGGVSGFVRKILFLMFRGESNLERGVVLVVDSRRLLVRGVFDGLMADLKALQEALGLKGAQGLLDTRSKTRDTIT